MPGCSLELRERFWFVSPLFSVLFLFQARSTRQHPHEMFWVSSQATMLAKQGAAACVHVYVCVRASQIQVSISSEQ